MVEDIEICCGLEGHDEEGEGVDDVVITNIKAVEDLGKIIESSYGPQGILFLFRT